MLTKRLIACFDIKDGNVTKAQKFQDNIFVGKAEDVAEQVYTQQIDELIFFDISASAEKRQIDIEMVKTVGKRVFVPFCVGGGIRNLDDMYLVLKSGAEKISVDSMAVRNPGIIEDGARAFGSQCIVLSMQVLRVEKTASIPSGYEVYIDGARHATGFDAIEWAKRGANLGAGEICINSIDNDGMSQGYDIGITKAIADAVKVPVIASGGAGKPKHLKELFTETSATGAIISSMLYSPRLERNYSVKELKEYLLANGILIRPYGNL